MDRDEIEDGVQQFSEHMQKIKPDFLFIPLYEGGHFQHDVVNYIVRRSLNETRSERIRVYEAPVYNFYYSWRTTPEKILSGLTRFIPFFRYLYPPEPVREADYFQLKMSPEQLKLKKHMLARFKTQNPGKLVERFGFEDRYQAFHDYDYSIPPFDYTRSLAKRLDNWKRFPVLGKIVSRMFKWTRTIHPDPDYTITNIPLHLKGQ